MRRPGTRVRPLARLRFAFEQLVLRGLKARLMIAAFIVVAVAVVAGLLVAGLDQGFAGPGEAVWWAFLRLTDPGYLGDDEGIARATISTIVTVLGYILFLGLLIAILTQWLNDKIKSLESGVSPVVLTDHIVVLGWTYQTAAIVKALLLTRGRVTRFLARRGAKELKIVIMKDSVDGAFLEGLGEQLDKVWDPRRVLVRAGTPLRVDHLERVAFRDAAAVILPGAGFAERNPERVDAHTIKTLASVSRYAQETGTAPPLAVAELFDARRVDVANGAYGGESEIIAADGMLSRLAAQSIRHRGLRSVMFELFTLNEGNAIYLTALDDQAGTTFHDLRGRFRKAVLIGFVRPGANRPRLDPDPEIVLAAEDQLVLLASSFEDCVADNTAEAGPASEARTEELRPPSGGPRRVLVLGWSRKVPALLSELARYGEDAFEVDVVSRTPVATRRDAMAPWADLLSNAKVQHVETSYTTPGVIEELEPAGYDNVVILASEQLERKEHADAISVVAALTVRALLPEAGERPRVLVELLDAENAYLFQGGDEEVMVSPTVVSYLVSQVALRRELAGVFWELTRPWGAQILLRGAADYLGTDGTVTFGAVERVAAQRGEIALGLRRPSDGQAGLCLNPDRDTEWALAPGDEVVDLISIEDPSQGGHQA